MRVALLTELYPPSIGGQELFFEGLGRALVERGHTVEVFCVGHEAGLPAHEILDAIAVHRFPSDPNYRAPTRPWMKRAWPTIFRYAFWTRRVVQSGNYDLVVLNQWPLLHAVTLPRRMRSRSVLHWCEVRDGRFYAAVQAWLPRFTAHNAAISDAVASAIGEASGKPVFGMPSGLRLEAYASAPREERRGILSLGRVAEHKNLPLLVAAFAVLKQRGYPGRLTIAGDGPAMADLRRAVQASAVASEISILGAVDDTEKTRLLAQSELFLLASRREGFPRVVAEAMASGLPVVTVDLPGNGTKEVVHAAGGGLVAPADPAALADVAQSVLGQWEDHSRAGLCYAKSLDWAQISERLERQIGWIAARPKVSSDAVPSHARR